MEKTHYEIVLRDSIFGQTLKSICGFGTDRVVKVNPFVCLMRPKLRRSNEIFPVIRASLIARVVGTRICVLIEIVTDIGDLLLNKR